MYFFILLLSGEEIIPTLWCSHYKQQKTKYNKIKLLWMVKEQDCWVFISKSILQLPRNCFVVVVVVGFSNNHKQHEHIYAYKYTKFSFY